MRSQLFASLAALRTLGLTGLCFLVCLVGAARTGRSQALSDSDLVAIQFQQKLGAQVPLGLRFNDETGRSVRFSEYLGKKPIVLVPGYYGCPMLCSMVLNGLVEAMQDMKWQLGRDFQVINYSIDPHETSSLANAKKHSYAKRYGRVGTDSGWHFLTGQDEAIRALSATIGFGYRLDPATGQYAHPSGIVVLTPQGKVAHYLFGVTFSSRNLYSALKEASSERVGSPIQNLLLLCFHYNPITGKYSLTILGILRVMSVATVLALIGLVAVTVHRSRAA